MWLASDQRLFGLIAIACVGALVAVYLLARAAGREPLGVLTPREWLIAAKLAGIVVMAVLLLQASIAFWFPIENLIYGRF